MSATQSDVSLHSPWLTAHVKETDRARSYLALGSLLGSGLSLSESADLVSRIWEGKERPGQEPPPVVKAMKDIVDGRSILEAFGESTMPSEEAALLLRVGELLRDEGGTERVLSLLQAAAEIVRFDLGMRRAAEPVR